MKLKDITAKSAAKDIFTGIIIALVSIPISMGYAQVSGLPAVYGLYGSVFPILIFGLFSTSKQFIFGVDAAPAALVGAFLATLGIENGSDEAVQLVPVISFLWEYGCCSWHCSKQGVWYPTSPLRSWEAL